MKKDVKPIDMMYQQRIHYLSIGLQLDRKQLAQKADMPLKELNKIMDSKIPNITITQAYKLSQALNVTMNYLIRGV